MRESPSANALPGIPRGDQRTFRERIMNLSRDRSLGVDGAVAAHEGVGVATVDSGSAS
jgi:hypothetical protein